MKKNILGSILIGATVLTCLTSCENRRESGAAPVTAHKQMPGDKGKSCPTCPASITHDVKPPLSGGRVHAMTDLARTYGSANDALQKAFAHQYVILEFYSDSCGPCKVFASTFVAIAQEYPSIIAIKANVSEFGNVASQYGVRGVPAIFLIKNGQVVKRLTGAQDKAVMRSNIKEAFGL